MWGVAGYGAGMLTLTPEGMAPIETDMDLAMGALGGRRVLVKPPAEGGLELSVESDALCRADLLRRGARDRGQPCGPRRLT